MAAAAETNLADSKSSFGTWLIFLLGVIIYWNSLNTPAMLDDHRTLYAKDGIRHLWPPMDARRPLGYYPFQIQYALHRDYLLGYHVVNVLVHIATAILLRELVQRSLLLKSARTWLADREAAVALAVALLWLVHPLNTSAVTYIMQRQEAQMSFFFLLVLYAANRAAGSLQPGKWHLLAVFSFALALTTKEVAATCPLVLALYDRVFLCKSWSGVARKLTTLYLPLLLPLA